MASPTPPAASAGLVGCAQRAIRRYGWQGAAREAVRRSTLPVLSPLATYRLRQRARSVENIEQLLHLAFGFEAYGITIRPVQTRWEFQRLLEAAAEIRPRAMLEIGTANGGSLFALTRVCADDAHIISVDLPHGQFNGGYPLWKVPIFKSFATPPQRLDLVRGDSHDPHTVARVGYLLSGRKLDLLFIDGDHRYEGVRQDFEAYHPLVRPGGLIGFHDIRPPDGSSGDGNRATQLVGDVPRFWSELRAERGGVELIDPDSRGCFGIGLLRV